MNVDWGLMAAVLSMVFTTFIGGITIWYTKNSLDYTKKSTQIADESLKATQKSIDTSIDIYENQKKFEHEEKKSRFNTLRKLIEDDLSWIKMELMQIDSSHEFIKENQQLNMHLIRQNDSLSILFDKIDGNQQFIGFNYIYINIDKYVYDIGLLDVDISISLSKIVRDIRHYNDELLLLINSSSRPGFSKIDLLQNVILLKLSADDVLYDEKKLKSMLSRSLMN